MTQAQGRYEAASGHSATILCFGSGNSIGQVRAESRPAEA
jgi:hypothetical protein